MSPEEYERRRRALEAQLQADLELVQAGHAARLRALEALRREAVETGTAGPGHEADRRPPAAVRTPDPPPTVRRRDNEALDDLQDLLPGLPVFFDKRDLVRALGYTPSRATFLRAIDKLREENKIRIAQHSQGGRLTRYEKLAAVAPSDDSAGSGLP